MQKLEYDEEYFLKQGYRAKIIVGDVVITLNRWEGGDLWVDIHNTATNETLEIDEWGQVSCT